MKLPQIYIDKISSLEEADRTLLKQIFSFRTGSTDKMAYYKMKGQSNIDLLEMEVLQADIDCFLSILQGNGCKFPKEFIENYPTTSEVIKHIQSEKKAPTVNILMNDEAPTTAPSGGGKGVNASVFNQWQKGKLNGQINNFNPAIPYRKNQISKTV